MKPAPFLSHRILGWLALAAIPSAGFGQPAEPWRVASLPGFRIYSNVPEARTRALLHSLAVTERDFDLVWPMPERELAEPAIMVLSDGGAELARLAAAPEGGKPVPFLRAGSNLAIDFRYRIPSLVNPRGYPPMADGFSQHWLQQSYARFSLQLVGERVPPWLRLGLDKLWEGMYCTDAAIEFQPLSTDATLPVRAQTHGSGESLDSALGKGEFLSLERLFSETSPPKPNRQPFVGGVNGINLIGPSNRPFWASVPYNSFMDEAYEFCLYGLIGDGGRHRDAFIRFVHAAANGPLDEAGFQRFFGLSYHQELLALWGYAAVGRDQTIPLSAAWQVSHPIADPVFRGLKPQELAQIEAEWRQKTAASKEPAEDGADLGTLRQN